MKRAVVIGSNRGIGLELVRGLVQKDFKVSAVCRKPSDDLSKVPGIDIKSDVDIRDENALQHLAQELGNDTVDLLLVNSGIMKSTTLENFDLLAIREQFEVNSLGPLLATHALLPTLKEAQKLR